MNRLEAALVVALLAPGVAGAADLPSPTGAVVLTVSGDIANTNNGSEADFDMAALEAMPGRAASMKTPWTEGKTAFSGPLLRSILSAVGARGRTIRLVALNDYAADIPVGDATDLDTMVATRMNGKAMSVRDRGPLFLIYPFDQSSDLYNEKYFSRSV
ncbi:MULTISPECIES: molybdopterin-dependent oxidoreductase [unclassified Aureimonas]|uniref:molybdopterin-dependent oxidoreductase n=1 Tax=unclassified Aureimonas TaxID=2615206 RepID=UPI0006FAFE7F|nr:MULTISPECIES: molybdopterin-dependent oxidoreductase [unclassified Aureimonas]KQT55181.1 hypothetical protein ASG62_10070 [Aureimonas sp. Leaf427]KQT70971.1 hypothetical protein ASG54_20455 [Aureimonas sp. Leaf460]